MLPCAACRWAPADRRQGWRLAARRLVIGHEETTGDPLFVDLAEPTLPVYTAMHGTGDWQPERVAVSAAAFFRSLELVGEVAHGRGSPAEREQNPLRDDERAAVLRRIWSSIPG